MMFVRDETGGRERRALRIGDVEIREIRKKLREYVERCVIVHDKADIKLSSGRMSDFYFDGRLVSLSPEPLELIASAVLALLEHADVEAVGGPVIGADPIVGAVVAMSARTSRPINGFMVRKEAKDRGTGRQVEGPPLRQSARVALVEDTVTSGGSLVRAAQAVRREAPGVQIPVAVCLVDRLEGGAEALKNEGIELKPIFTKRDFAASLGGKPS